MLYIEVNGVNRFCRSKFSAGSWSWKYPIGTGGCASVGVRIASYSFITGNAARSAPCSAACAWNSCGALVASPRSRSQRVSGWSRCSLLGRDRA